MQNHLTARANRTKGCGTGLAPPRLQNSNTTVYNAVRDLAVLMFRSQRPFPKLAKIRIMRPTANGLRGDRRLFCVFKGHYGHRYCQVLHAQRASLPSCRTAAGRWVRSHLGCRTLRHEQSHEGQKLSFDVQADARSGKFRCRETCSRLTPVSTETPAPRAGVFLLQQAACETFS